MDIPGDRVGHPLKIVFVIGSLNLGGAEQQMSLLVESLCARGHLCHVFVLEDSGPLRGRLLATGCTIHAYGWDQRYGQSRRLVRLFRPIWATVNLWWLLLKLRPDVLHAYLPLTNLMGAIAGCLGRVPRIITCRRGLGTHQDRYPLFRYLDRLANAGSDVVVANSEAVARDTLARDHLRPNKLRVIRNGLDLARGERKLDNTSTRAELGLGEEGIGLVSVANLIPYKGHRELLTAISLLSDWPIQTFLVGRDDGIQAELSELASKLGIADRVHFLGSRSDVVRLLSAMDIFVLASHEEGSSNALLEAMACGLSVVATDVGGNRESLADGRYGILVPPRDPQALAYAIEEMLSRRVVGTDKNCEAINFVRHSYSVDAMVEGYLSLYYGN